MEMYSLPPVRAPAPVHATTTPALLFVSAIAATVPSVVRRGGEECSQFCCPSASLMSVFY